MAIVISDLPNQLKLHSFYLPVTITGTGGEYITGVTISPVDGDSGIIIDNVNRVIKGNYFDTLLDELWYVEKGESDILEDPVHVIGLSTPMSYVIGLGNMPEGKDLFQFDTSTLTSINKYYDFEVTSSSGTHTETKAQKVLNWNDEYYDWLKGYIERNNG
jgi:hypothetical protein